MKTTIVACKTLEDEINQALSKTSIDYPVKWIESGLHNYPEKLNEAIQNTIDEITDSEYILLIFGLCGNSLLGLTSPKASLVLPRVDDCISLFLGGNDKRKMIEEKSAAYYLTKGWLRYENNIWQEYIRSVEKYGKERTKDIFATMLKHYTHLVVIDTGAYNTDLFLKEAEEIAAELNLELKLIPADLNIIKDALKQNWHEEFILVEPGKSITMQDTGICGRELQ
ncbi:MAG: DUF1638 domain-containing protein [Bacillota bacterium]